MMSNTFAEKCSKKHPHKNLVKRIKKQEKMITQILLLSFKVRHYNYLDPLILASMLKVACGTARKRALSINLPVTLQMP